MLFNGADCDLNYEESSGEGKTIVFVHGLAGDKESWRPQLTHFSKRFRTIALELLGHGESSIPNSMDCSVSDLGRDISSLMEHLRLDKPILVGHSLGCAAIISFLSQHENGVSKIILVDSTVDVRKFPKKDLEKYYASLRTNYKQAITSQYESLLQNALPATRDQVLRNLSKMNPEIVTSLMNDLASFDPISPLEAFDGPVFSILTPWGDTPIAIPSLLPKIVTTKIDGVSHWVQLDRPGQVNNVLENFSRNEALMGICLLIRPYILVLFLIFQFLQ